VNTMGIISLRHWEYVVGGDGGGFELGAVLDFALPIVRERNIGKWKWR